MPGAAAPALAAALRATGAQAACVTGGDDDAAAQCALDWIDTPHAAGWLALPRIATRHTHGTGCTFATSAAAALALGFVPADALVLATMATAHALAEGYAAGQGAGPVAARSGFARQPALLPLMSWDEGSQFNGAQTAPSPAQDLGLYAIVDSAARVRQAVAAGVRTVQLRIKEPPGEPALRQAIVEALAACRAAGATLVVNDHWRLAAELGAPAIHLGQEDLLALGAAGRAELAASGLRLGISSHSLWELCRARGLRPWYIACGPVWPTLTKAMPWLPQGLDNLSWWARMAGAPVVAIGGVLQPAQLTEAVRGGASSVCVVRGLGDDLAATVPRWQAALTEGRAAPRLPTPDLPHPTLR